MGKKKFNSKSSKISKSAADERARREELMRVVGAILAPGRPMGMQKQLLTDTSVLIELNDVLTKRPSDEGKTVFSRCAQAMVDMLNGKAGKGPSEYMKELVSAQDFLAADQKEWERSPEGIITKELRAAARRGDADGVRKLLNKMTK